LRRLGVRVERQDRVPVLPGEPDEGLPQGEARAQHGQHAPPLPHPVHRHVDVVAAAGRVEAAGDGVAAAFDEQAIDIEEQVLARTVELRPAGVLDVDGVQAVAQGAGILAGHDAPVREHHEMGRAGSPATGREQRLGVVEVLAKDAVDVLGCKGHGA